MFRPNVTAHHRPGQPRAARRAGVLILSLAVGVGAAAFPASAAAAAPPGAAEAFAPWWTPLTALWGDLLDGLLASPSGVEAVTAGSGVDPQHGGVLDPDGESTEDCIDCVDPQHRGVADPDG